MILSILEAQFDPALRIFRQGGTCSGLLTTVGREYRAYAVGAPLVDPKVTELRMVQ